MGLCGDLYALAVWPPENEHLIILNCNHVSHRPVLNPLAKRSEFPPGTEFKITQSVLYSLYRMPYEFQ
jgi:hypothetical protein